MLSKGASAWEFILFLRKSGYLALVTTDMPSYKNCWGKWLKRLPRVGAALVLCRHGHSLLLVLSSVSSLISGLSFFLFFYFIVSNCSPVFFLILGQNKICKLLTCSDDLSQCAWTGTQLCWDPEMQRTFCVRMWWPILRKSISAIES